VLGIKTKQWKSMILLHVALVGLVGANYSLFCCDQRGEEQSACSCCKPSAGGTKESGLRVSCCGPESCGLSQPTLAEAPAPAPSPARLGLMSVVEHTPLLRGVYFSKLADDRARHSAVGPPIILLTRSILI
jgi:hypothetical protein